MVKKVISTSNGVGVNEIRRITSGFLNQQLWRATTAQHCYGSTQDYLISREGPMAEEGSSSDSPTEVGNCEMLLSLLDIKSQNVTLSGDAMFLNDGCEFTR